MQDLLRRYLRAWQLADIHGLVALITEDVTFSMPPMPTSFQGRDAVAAFVDTAVFTPARPRGVPVHSGTCNGQLAVATYAPDHTDDLVVTGLQILQLALVDDTPLITAITSYRDPALALRCGLPRTYSVG